MSGNVPSIQADTITPRQAIKNPACAPSTCRCRVDVLTDAPGPCPNEVFGPEAAARSGAAGTTWRACRSGQKSGYVAQTTLVSKPSFWVCTICVGAPVKLVSHSVLALLSEPVVAIHSGASCRGKSGVTWGAHAVR
jgi:hypothetical protein